MGMDHQKLTVQTVNFFHGKGPVFYASLPCGPMSGQMPAGPVTKEPAQNSIDFQTVGSLCRCEKRLWMHRAYDNPDAFPIQIDPFIRVIRGPLGRPQLLLGDHIGPAISFCASSQNLLGRALWRWA